MHVFFFFFLLEKTPQLTLGVCTWTQTICLHLDNHFIQRVFISPCPGLAFGSLAVFCFHAGERSPPLFCDALERKQCFLRRLQLL